MKVNREFFVKLAVHQYEEIFAAPAGATGAELPSTTEACGKRWVDNPPPNLGGATLLGPQGLSKVAPFGVTNYRSVEGCRGATGASVVGPRGASSWCCDGLAGLSYQRLRPRPAWMMLWRLPHASSDWPPAWPCRAGLTTQGGPGKEGRGACFPQVRLPDVLALPRLAYPGGLGKDGGSGTKVSDVSRPGIPALGPGPGE